MNSHWVIHLVAG